jgi:nucleotide-binding universal stress UspA family protein
MIKSILLPIDGSVYTESVLQYGQYLAQKLGAILRVLTIVDIRLFDWNITAGADSFVPVIPSADFQEESQKMQDEKAQQIIGKSTEILKKSGIQFEVEKASGIPIDEICYHARSNDMVVMGIRGEYERWSGKFLGATVEGVTRQITKPTLLVDKTFAPFERILCGYDGSDTANKALQLSAYFSNALNLTLQVIAVFDSEEERRTVLTEAERYLLPYKIDFQLRHESGDAAAALCNACVNAPSLTIIGAYGHSRLREAILGSTTVQVMRLATKPVLLAK